VFVLRAALESEAAALAAARHTRSAG
jgi:DNA-binding FadR family transcriptional regulator